MNHEQDWHSAIVARALPCSTNNRFNRFFASFEISWKYSSGNEKSHFKMFAVVSSTESSKNGETPLKNTYNKTPKHQQSAQEKWAFISVLLKESTHRKKGELPVAVPNAVCPITTSGAENSRFDGGRMVFRLIAVNASPKSINFNCGFCNIERAVEL